MNVQTPERLDAQTSELWLTEEIRPLVNRMYLRRTWFTLALYVISVLSSSITSYERGKLVAFKEATAEFQSLFEQIKQSPCLQRRAVHLEVAP